MDSICPAVPARTLSPGCPPQPTIGAVLPGKLSDCGDRGEAEGRGSIGDDKTGVGGGV